MFQSRISNVQKLFLPTFAVKIRLEHCPIGKMKFCSENFLAALYPIYT